jgi:NADH pyrophosphatase NudC (nudix superfamily)
MLPHFDLSRRKSRVVGQSFSFFAGFVAKGETKWTEVLRKDMVLEAVKGKRR